MPWTRKQKKVARAVEHGWKPMGSAKGFTHDFARQVMVESNEEAKPKSKRKRRKARSR